MKTSENKGFLTFLDGIEMEHWAKMLNQQPDHTYNRAVSSAFIVILTSHGRLQKII